MAATAPGVPQHLNVSSHDAGALDLYWEAPGSDGGSPITGYKVQWKQAADGWDTPEDVSGETVTGTSHTLTGLTAGAEYTIRVIASNSVGDGPASVEVAAEAPEQETAIWSAVLTVGVKDEDTGYSYFTSFGSLSKTGFTVDDANYTVMLIVHSDDKLYFSLNNTMTAGFVLRVGAFEFASVDASPVEGGATYLLKWDQPGLSWSEGDKVGVGLTLVEESHQTVPDENSPATGLPVIRGTARVGETLTADTSGIADADGLTNVSYSYQWIRSDGSGDTDIAGETASTYTLVNDDAGKTIKVTVSFTDAEGNAETLTSAATGAVEAAATAAGPPNVLVILVDDLGYNDVSYNGATEIQTTNIDQLARSGIIFKNGYVVAPICTPSRAGLLTGRYPSRFGLEGNLSYAPFDAQHGLPIEETLFPANLVETGYRTGIVGKWQLGAARKFNPLNRGFGYFFGFLGGRHDYWEVDTSKPSDESLIPLVENRGVGEFSGYLTDALTDKAIEFIENPQDAPFFLYLAYNAPHGPLQAPAELIDKYSHIDDLDRRTYLAMVDSLDHNIGRVIAALEQAGERDNTIVFFLSDNGGLAGDSSEAQYADNGPLRAGKGSFYEGGIHVPFVASWPARWPQGETYEPMVISMDIAATVLELGSAATDNTDRRLDGVNLDPYLRGERDGPPHEALFWRHWRTGGYTVRSGDMKLVKDRTEVVSWAIPRQDQDEAPLLFNLQSDLGEMTDLLADEAAKTKELASLWNEWNQGNEIGNLFYGINWYDNAVRNITQEFAATNLDWATRYPRYEIGIETAPAESENSSATGQPTIDGEARVGETLTADTFGITDDDGLDNAVFAYQWVRNDGSADAEIAGATGSGYTLAAADVGKAIKVKVSFTDDADHEETLTSAATAAVAARPNTPATGAPAIAGTAQMDETLTADTSGIADADGLDNAAFTYQWVRNDGTGDADIPGATSSTYTPSDEDVGKTIKVRVSFADDAGNGESLTGEATAAVEAAPNSPATGAPAISGVAQVGKTLTADVSGIDDADGLDNGSYSYQWIRSDGNDDTDISGESASTYTLVSTDQGKTIKVRVTFTDDRGHGETLTSAATDSVAGPPSEPLTVSLENEADTHDGETPFTFELRFSEEFHLSYTTLRDHGFTVAGGKVEKAQRLTKGSNIHWRITVQPDSNADVTITLPATGDCGDTGAICTGDGRKLSNRLELTVSGPDS